MKNFSPSNSIPRIPDHELIRRIGQGNYGEVWLARNAVGTYRAVKFVFRTNFEKERPYERELRGLKKFEPISRGHPGLVDILQVGLDEKAGTFFYVMELADDIVPERPFDPNTYAPKNLSEELSNRRRIPALEAIQIGRALADGLDFLHANELVHRDIKPSNIIFVKGEPKLADVGLVMSLFDDRTVAGTEGYIPLEGMGTIQADIFSLGKVLYEISTGQDRTLFPALPENLEEFPDKNLVLELNEVVVKACANESRARYARASEIRRDLEKILTGRSVVRERFLERQLKRAKRITFAASLLAVVAAGFGFGVNYLRARQRHVLARAYETDGTQILENGNFHAALPAFIEALRLERNDLATVETHRTRIGSLLQQSPSLLQFWQMNQRLSDVRFHPDGKRLLVAGADRAQLLNIETGALEREFPIERDIETAAFSPDGTSIAFAGKKMLTVVDVAAGTNYFSIKSLRCYSAEFSPDGQMIVVACDDNRAYVINARSGEIRGRLAKGHKSMVAYSAFSPDGSSIATVSFDGTARIWDVKTWQPLFVPLPHVEWLPPQRSKPPVFAVAFSPDGQRIVTGGLDGMLRIWNTATGQPISVRMEHHGQVRRVSFSPDGRFIVSAGFDGAVHFWDAHTGQSAEATLNLHAAAMQAAFDSEGRRVATISSAGEVRVWHVTPDAPINVGRATMSGNGERYVTFSENEFRAWNARDDAPLTPPRDAGGIIITGICNFTGQRIALRTQSKEAGSELVHIFNETGASLSEFVVPSPGRHWWLNGTGTRLITGSEKDVFLWDASNGKMIFGPPKYSGPIQVAAFSPNEKFLAMAIGSKVFVLDPNSGAELLPPFTLPQKVKSICFSPDSRWLATGQGENSLNPATALVWSLATGKSTGVSLSHADAVASVNFSHDGRLIATASDDNHAGIWIASTGKPSVRSLSFIAQVHTTAFSADDRWLLTATYFEAQVWDTRTGHAVTPRFVDPSVFSGAGFCAGGQRMWVQSRRGLLFWNLPRATADPDELIAFTENLGVTISGNVRGKEAEALLAGLRRFCAAARARTANVEAWHREQEELCEAQGDWFAAQFHLERLLAKTPGAVELHERSEKIKNRLSASPLPAVAPAAR